jgi:hypothetical protein
MVMIYVTDKYMCSELLIIGNDSYNGSCGGGHVGCGCGFMHVSIVLSKLPQER